MIQQKKSILEIVQAILNGGSFKELTMNHIGSSVSVYTKRLVTIVLLHKGYNLSNEEFTFSELIALYEKTTGKSAEAVWNLMEQSTSFTVENWLDTWRTISLPGAKRTRVFEKIKTLQEQLTDQQCEKIFTYALTDEELEFAAESMSALVGTVKEKITV